MREIVIGGIYKHFKGQKMQVIAVGKDSEDLSLKVIYKHLGTEDVWVRDMEEFLSFVDKEKYPECTQEYRFELIEEKNEN